MGEQPRYGPKQKITARTVAELLAKVEKLPLGIPGGGA
jgi:hypothetical protein